MALFQVDVIHRIVLPDPPGWQDEIAELRAQLEDLKGLIMETRAEVIARLVASDERLAKAEAELKVRISDLGVEVTALKGLIEAMDDPEPELVAVAERIAARAGALDEIVPDAPPPEPEPEPQP